MSELIIIIFYVRVNYSSILYILVLVSYIKTNYSHLPIKFRPEKRFHLLYSHSNVGLCLGLNVLHPATEISFYFVKILKPFFNRIKNKQIKELICTPLHLYRQYFNITIIPFWTNNTFHIFNNIFVHKWKDLHLL